MVMSRYDFLKALHDGLRPETYLEVGVQYGSSMRLANPDTYCIGIDPNPQTDLGRTNVEIYPMTSDTFFGHQSRADTSPTPPEWEALKGRFIDLAFIDGMHLFEYALRDFRHIESWCTPKSIVIFDDVLPYNQAIAAREQPPGDWTGDVWKIFYVLKANRPDLKLTLVDVAPTGLLVVQSLDPDDLVLWEQYDSIVNVWTQAASAPVPDEIIDRSIAIQADVALSQLLHGD